jgi:hypothetical protein
MPRGGEFDFRYSNRVRLGADEEHIGKRLTHNQRNSLKTWEKIKIAHRRRRRCNKIAAESSEYYIDPQVFGRCCRVP